MKTGIVFDLDGTLLDTLADLTDAVNYALAAYGFPPRSQEEIRRFVGNGVGLLIRRALPPQAQEANDAVLACFRRYYDAHCQVKTRPYPGIPAVLADLKAGYSLAIVSNKPDSAVKRLCRADFPGIYALGELPDCPRKPAPDMVYRAMAVLGVERCVYVGDSEVDVATAKNAAVPCVSVTWGFRDEAALTRAGAGCLCRTQEALPDAITEVLNGK